jgi:hypothetical protein
VKKTLALLAAVLALAACTEQKNKKIDFTKVNSFKVEVTSGAMGTEASPLAFTASGMNLTLRVTALDGMAQPVTSFAGPVQVSSEPGNTFLNGTMSFSNGVGTGSITMKKAFGVTRVWVEDPATMATGVTDPIFIRGPKIYDVQISPNTVNSPFNNERVLIDDQSTLVVTEIARDGFYLQDVDVANGAWASIYAFTFGAPHGIQPGDRITHVQGTVGEFIDYTELNNPSWTTTGTTLPIPPHKLLSCTDVNSPLTMESYEAGLIEVNDAQITVCPQIATTGCPDYDQYKQWTITVNAGGCLLNVVSNYTLPNFKPTDNVGKTFTKLRGTLRDVGPANPEWILEPHSPADACCPTCSPAITQGC